MQALGFAEDICLAEGQADGLNCQPCFLPQALWRTDSSCRVFMTVQVFCFKFCCVLVKCVFSNAIYTVFADNSLCEVALLVEVLLMHQTRCQLPGGHVCHISCMTGFRRRLSQVMYHAIEPDPPPPPGLAVQYSHHLDQIKCWTLACTCGIFGPV
mmetsp:Transcript_72925/g.122223  ORF Transcript_72925/g.122223 Transcript_72925/m.122223 type:complete len:155 (-) Transcript_72925:8-472(-)